MSTPLLRKGSAAGKGSRGRKGSAASKASRGSNGRKRAGTGGGKGKKKEWKLTAAALKEGVRTPNWAPQSNADLGIPEKSCQALICKDCQDLYLKEEEKRKIKKKETVVVDVTKEKIVTVSTMKNVATTHTAHVPAGTQLSAGGLKPTAEHEATWETWEVKTVQEKKKVTEVVQEEQERTKIITKVLPGFRYCCKCFPELARELGPDVNNNAYLCMKCKTGNGSANLPPSTACCKCSKQVGGLAGVGGAMLCDRHASPPRCFRCGT